LILYRNKSCITNLLHYQKKMVLSCVQLFKTTGGLKIKQLFGQ
jgi:hypothetical protein